MTKSNFSKISGNEKTLRFLERSWAKNKLSQGYVFFGPEGVGKFKTALAFAQMILGEKPGGLNDSVLILEPGKKINYLFSALTDSKKGEEKEEATEKSEIKVEEVRELRRQLGLKDAGGKKVAIIREAEKLNNSSQSVLLKTLEEPGEGLTLILVTNDKSRLFPTILSRCQRIRFGLVPDREIEKLILSQTGKKLPDEEKKEIIFWAAGRPGFTLELLQDQKKLKTKKEAWKEFQQLFKNNLSEKFSFAQDLSSDPRAARKKMEEWIIGIRKDFLEGRETHSSLEKKLELLERISQTLKLLKGTNANLRLALENLLLSFYEK
jgi:DNA polymerase III subunit delta'